MAERRSPKATSKLVAEPPVADIRAQLSLWAEDHDVELIFFDPPEVFDAAIVGVVEGFDQEPAVLYDQAQVLAGFVAQGMDEDEAVEWFEYNTRGAFLGPATPRFLLRPDQL